MGFWLGRGVAVILSMGTDDGHPWRWVLKRQEDTLGTEKGLTCGFFITHFLKAAGGVVFSRRVGVFFRRRGRVGGGNGGVFGDEFFR